MTAIEVGRIEETLVEPTDEDDLPIGHLPDEASFVALLQGQRPSKALCGADLLGIKAEGDFKRCETCDEIAFKMGIPHE